jgi:hypothetical protein
MRMTAIPLPNQMSTDAIMQIAAESVLVKSANAPKMKNEIMPIHAITSSALEICLSLKLMLHHCLGAFPQICP